jgi:hypothetical protein
VRLEAVHRSTWNSIEVPPLLAVRSGELSTDRSMFIADDAARGAGIDDISLATRRMRALAEDGYVAFDDDGGLVAGPGFYIGLRLTGQGRRAIGQWPAEGNEAVDAFLARIEQAIERSDDDVERSGLRLVDASRVFARDVSVEVAAAVLTGGV